MKAHPKKPKKKRQAPPKERVLTWMKAKRKDLTRTGTKRRVWESHCRRYRVEEIAIQLALTSDPYPPYYLAIHQDLTHPGGLILSEHRKRSTAEDACERHVQKDTELRRKVAATRRGPT